MKNKKRSGRIIAACLAAAMALTMAGCGKNGAQQPVDNVQSGVNGFVYVPEFVSMGGEDEEANYGQMYFSGKYMYYTQDTFDEETQSNTTTFYKKELTGDGQAEKLSFQLEGQKSVMQMLPDKDGNVFLFINDYSEENTNSDGHVTSETILTKYDAQGTQVFEQNLTGLLEGNSIYIQRTALDGEGRVYASTDSGILLFGADGSHQGEVKLGTDSWISGLGTGKDGKVYFCQYAQNSNGMVLSQINFDTKSVEATFENFPQSSSVGVVAGMEKDFMAADSSSLYEYDMSTQSSEKVLDWLDSDINGTFVEYLAPLEDGRLLVMIRDWNTGEKDMAYLTKTEASQVPEKKIITVGTLSMDQSLQASAVKFNKTNGQYRIKLKQYIDFSEEWTENTWTEGIQRMNNDITGSNPPDIVDLSNVNISQLASKGVLEDLTPMLDASSNFSKDDFVESVINSYTINDILVGIPTSFFIQTVFGRTSEVGEKMGWTLDELLAYADKYPDSEIFEWATSDTIINFCLSFNQAAFIDWEKGSCSFNSDDFRKVLEFASRFPTEFKETDYNNEKSTPKKIQDRDVLLYRTTMTGVDEFQVSEGIFGEPVTAIGYPTVDGSAGSILNAQAAYGIISKSANKDGAWQFLEMILSEGGSSSMFSWGFSSRKAELEKNFEESMKAEYVLDENGEPLLDEKGEKILMNSSSYGWGDFEIEIKPSTQEQIDMVKEIIASAKPSVSSDEMIMKVISEEAAPYFAGQKSIDEVVDVIQSRVQIYISENS